MQSVQVYVVTSSFEWWATVVVSAAVAAVVCVAVRWLFPQEQRVYVHIIFKKTSKNPSALAAMQHNLARYAAAVANHVRVTYSYLSNPSALYNLSQDISTAHYRALLGVADVFSKRAVDCDRDLGGATLDKLSENAIASPHGALVSQAQALQDLTGTRIVGNVEAPALLWVSSQLVLARDSPRIYIVFQEGPNCRRNDAFAHKLASLSLRPQHHVF